MEKTGIRKCSIVGCENRHYAKSFCKKHYMSYLRVNKRPLEDKDKKASRNLSYRARKKYGVTNEHIVRREIFDNCHWLCGICRQPVDKNLKYPHPMSASLDHIIPLSKGGKHSKDNVQLAHFSCNSKKGAR